MEYSSPICPPQAIEQLLMKGIKARSDSAEERECGECSPPTADSHSPISQLISIVVISVLTICLFYKDLFYQGFVTKIAD
jgi:hypothetical protein